MIDRRHQPDVEGVTIRRQAGQVGHIVTSTRFVLSDCRKALPIFPQLPFADRMVELWEF